MKVCFVSFEYPPFVIGGAGVYAKCITRELAGLGHEVHVISPYVGSGRFDAIEHQVFVHRIPIVNRHFLSSPSFWVKLTGYYESLSKKVGGFDLLHSNSISDLSLSHRSVKEPRVVTIHHLARTLLQIEKTSLVHRLLNLSGERGITSFFEKVVISRADMIIAVSRFTKTSLMSTYGVSPSHIKVIYNGVYPEKFMCSEKEVVDTRNLLGLKEDEIVFLFVGRLEDKRKNLPQLLKAFQILCQEHKKPLKLVVVGRGDYSALRSLTASFGIKEQILFTGFVDDEYLRKIFNSCDVLVSPSILEGFGITLLEAMAAGKPIIAYKAGAIPELIENDVHGKLIEVGKLSQLVDAMMFFVDNPESTKKIGENNKKYVIRRFDWERAARETECIYRKLVSV